MLHGRDEAEKSERAAAETFASGGASADLPSLSTGGSITLLAALTGLGFCASNGEAKRKIAEGAVKLDDQVVNDPASVVTIADQPVKLSLGKKRHGLLTA